MSFLWNLGKEIWKEVQDLQSNLTKRVFLAVINELINPYVKNKLELEEGNFSDGTFTFKDILLDENMVTKKLGKWIFFFSLFFLVFVVILYAKDRSS